MNHTEQTAMIEQMRQRALTEQTALYRRAGVPVYGRYDARHHLIHSFHHLLLFLFSLCVLFFAADYLDTEHDYVAVISDAVTSNEQFQETYDKIENSDFINWLVELVTPIVNKYAN